MVNATVGKTTCRCVSDCYKEEGTRLTETGTSENVLLFTWESDLLCTHCGSPTDLDQLYDPHCGGRTVLCLVGMPVCDRKGLP